MTAGTTRSPVRRAWRTALDAIQPDDNLSAVIYGQLITGATLASAVGEVRSLGELVVVAVTTIAVFSIADAYADVVAARLAARRRDPAVDEQLRPRLRRRIEVRRAFAMGVACLPPLAVLAVATAFGASLDVACYLGLGLITLSLMGYGFRSARHAGLSPTRQVLVAVLHGVLGGAIIFLKAEVLH